MPLTAPSICIFNTTSHLIDVTVGSITGPGVPGTPVVLNASGLVDPTLIGNGVSAIAGENIQAGGLVNLYSNAGVLYAELAFAAGTGVSPSGTPYPVLAAGFVTTIAASSSVATISFDGIFQYVDAHGEFSAADIGKEIYLSAIDKGGITKTRPSGAGQADQAVGYVLAFNATGNIVTSLFLAGFNDFSHISGIAQISQGGTGAGTALGAIHNIFGQPAAATFFAGVVSGPVADATFRSIANTDLSGAVFGASGASHNPGAVPDPGAVPGSPSRFLREDATWAVPIVPPIPSDHPGLVASAGPFTITTPAATGMFRVSAYAECTAAGANAGSPFGAGVFGAGVFNPGDDNVQVVVGWTDDVTARTSVFVLDCGGTNAASNDVFIRGASGQAVTLQTYLNHTGSPTYSVYSRTETL